MISTPVEAVIAAKENDNVSQQRICAYSTTLPPTLLDQEKAVRFLNYLPSLATRHYSLITLVFCWFHRNVSRGGKQLDVQISRGLIDSGDTYGFRSKCEDMHVLLTVVLHTQGHKHTLGGTHIGLGRRLALILLFRLL